MPKIISMDEFAARRARTEHYTENWGGWTTLSREPAVNYANLRKVYQGRKVHEDDFLLFRHFDGRKGLFVDIGANMGFSAVSFRNVNRSMGIVSFEILPLLRDVLQLLKADLDDFNFHMIGISDRAERTTMYVPVFRSLLCTPFASLDAGQFELPHRKQEWHRNTGQNEFELLALPVELRTLDEFALTPTIVKIDVEGVELRTMRGAEATLLAHRPIVICEKNDDLEFVTFMQQLGFEAMAYSVEKNALWRLSAGPIPVLNVFFVHPDRKAEIRATGVAVG